MDRACWSESVSLKRLMAKLTRALLEQENSKTIPGFLLFFFFPESLKGTLGEINESKA